MRRFPKEIQPEMCFEISNLSDNSKVNVKPIIGQREYNHMEHPGDRRACVSAPLTHIYWSPCCFLSEYKYHVRSPWPASVFLSPGDVSVHVKAFQRHASEV